MLYVYFLSTVGEMVDRVGAVKLAVAVGIATFAVLSHVMRRYPIRRVRDRRTEAIRAKRIGHRGDRVEYAENTMQAFKHAMDFVDMIELDVWYTSDKRVVVFHDGHFDRCCGTSGHVNDTLFSDLPSLKLPTNDEWLQGSYKLSNGESVDLTIPLLETVLEEARARNKSVLIEIKESKDTSGIVKDIHRMVTKTKMLERTCWFSLKSKNNSIIASFNRDLERRGLSRQTLPTLVSAPGVVRTLLLYYTGLLPFFDFSHAIFGIPVYNVDMSKPLPFQNEIPIPKFIYAFIVSILIGPRGLLYSEKLCRHLRARGAAIWALGVNADNVKDVDHPKQLKSRSAARSIGRRIGMTGCLSDCARWMSREVDDADFLEVRGCVRKLE
eukprot:g1681.t1